MTAAPRHLLIDGYNVIHAIPDLKACLGEGVEAARARLVSWVSGLHDIEGIRVTVVFDGRGDDVEIERPSGDLTLSVLYSPRGISADGVIEQLVGTAVTPGNIQVVTRDNLVRETIRALGAEPLTPGDLRDWVERCERKVARELRQRRTGIERAWRRRE